MSMDFPYFYLEFKNLGSNQWHDLDGNEISRIALSNIHFDNESEPYLYSGLGVARFNLGLEISSISQSLSEDFYTNPCSNIDQLEFSISRAWKNRYATKIVRDWHEAMRKAFGNSNFTLSGSQVTCWVANGTVPGFIDKENGNWEEISTGVEYPWTPSKTNTALPQFARIIFQGRVKKRETSKDRIKFLCEGNQDFLDVSVGSVSAQGKNSSSEIVPICFGDTTDTELDADQKYGFPMSQDDGVNGAFLRPCDGGANRVDAVFYPDGATGYPCALLGGFKHSNGVISISADVGASLSTSRASSGLWSLTDSERAVVADFPVSSVASQTIHTSNGESVCFNAETKYGAVAIPPVAPPFDTSNVMEARGWNNSKRASHTAGTAYNKQGAEDNGARVNVEIVLPATEIIQQNLQWSQYDEKVLGASGNLWQFIRATTHHEQYQNSDLVFSSVNYGPGLLNGNITDLQPTKSAVFRLTVRPARPDFDDGGEDYVYSVSLTPRYYISPGVGSFGGGISSAKIYAGFKYGAGGLGDYTDSILIDSVDNGESPKLETKTTSLSLPFTTYINAVITFKDIFEGNALTYTVDLYSNYEVIGNAPNQWIGYTHALSILKSLWVGFKASVFLKDRKMFWKGSGLGGYTAASNIISAIGNQFSNQQINVVPGNSVNLCGAITKETNLRDVLKDLCRQSLTILREREGIIDVLPIARAGTFKTISDSDIFLDDNGNLEMSCDETDVQNLYTGVCVSFRKGTDNKTASTIGIKSGNSSERYKAHDVPYYSDYDSERWNTSSTTLANLWSVCISASNARQAAGIVNDNILTFNAPFVRNRESAERLLALLIMFACTTRNIVNLQGPIRSFYNYDIGDQVEFNISQEYRDIYTYLPSGASRRFVVVKRSIMQGDYGMFVDLTLSELPYNANISVP